MVSRKKVDKVLHLILLLAATSSAKEINESRKTMKAFQMPSSFLWDDSWCDHVEQWFTYPHPLHCDSFLICFNGRLYEDICDDNFIFDDWFWQCLPPGQANCQILGTNPTPDRLQKCPVGFFGRLPHPEDCSLYFHCVNGRRNIGRCLPLLRFDMERRRCVLASSARCMNN